MQRQYVYLDAAFGEPVCPSNGMNTVAGAQQRYPAGMASDSRVIWIVHTGTYKPARKTSWLCNVRAMGKATCYRNESSRRNVCLKRSDTNMPSTLRRCRAHTFEALSYVTGPAFLLHKVKIPLRQLRIAMFGHDILMAALAHGGQVGLGCPAERKQCVGDRCGVAGLGRHSAGVVGHGVIARLDCEQYGQARQHVVE